MYFITKEFNAEEFKEYTTSLRGSTIIKLDYGKNIFKDTHCFVPFSLTELSKDYKVECPKLEELMVDGKVRTNEEMCFYKPELDMYQFVELEKAEPEFWSLYNEYCRVGCVALSQIWDKFSSNVEELMDKFIENAPVQK
jgi:hypothetical protein